MERWQHVKTPLIVVGLALAASAWFWPTLPDIMPTHWNAAGEANGTMPKYWGALLMPALMATFVLVPSAFDKLMRAGRLGADGADRADAAHVGAPITTAILFLLLATHIAVLVKASGAAIALPRLTHLMLGIALVPIGNVVSKLRRNAFVGIKTPWAFADDEVWLRTQRFGGRALIISGALIAITAAAGFNLGSLRAILVGMGAITMLYSWWVYRRLVLRAPPSR